MALAKVQRRSIPKTAPFTQNVDPPIACTWMNPQGTPVTKVKFIEPMYTRLVNELPEGKDWLYEV